MKKFALVVVGLSMLILSGCSTSYDGRTMIGPVTIWNSNIRSPLDGFHLPDKPVVNHEFHTSNFYGDTFDHSEGSSVSGYENWTPFSYQAGVSIFTWNNTTVSRGNGFYYPYPIIVNVSPTIPSGSRGTSSGQPYGGAGSKQSF